MTIDSFIARMRRRHVEVSRGACVITRPSGQAPVYDPATHDYTPPAAVQVYEGSCNIVPLQSFAVVDEQASERVHMQMHSVRLPYDSPEMRVGDLIEVTDSLDAELVGRTLVVREVPYSDYLVSRRLVAELVIA